ncbi:hypothetical protein KAM380_080270 [Aeromonas caviae]|nr:hypothetical protein KAM380_080270 [Aeromonas caviae]
MADFLARTRHHFDQEAQIGRGIVAAGLLNQIATKGNAGHVWLRKDWGIKTPAVYRESCRLASDETRNGSQTAQ